ncbi:MAG: pyruvate kinase [Fimbriimonadaceae bacterium]|nr:pyruvate kinase [Fimbriimonadaceae bacterium]
MPSRRTKIVATLGPACHSEGAIQQLIKAGMNMARLNCSHGEWDVKAEAAAWVRSNSAPVAPIALMADLQGPKHRLGTLPGDGLNIRAGQKLTYGPEGEDVQVPILDEDVYSGLRVGDKALIGDGEISLKVIEQQGSRGVFSVIDGGTLKSRKGVTVIGKSFDSRALTDKDKFDIFQAAQLEVDYIALSYVRSSADLLELRREVDKYDPKIRLIAKIETKEALKDIDAVIASCDGVMVARGDLGLQIAIEDVPLAQKRIIERANRIGKPVITATQMLESMVTNPRPTRAEATDVANAILDGTDAVMLSGETAAGAHPVAAVATMAKIAEKTELHQQAKTSRSIHLPKGADCTEAVAQAAVQIAHSLEAKAVVTASTSGATPRMVRKFNPNVPILCATWDPRVHRQLALVGGVQTVLIEHPETTDEAVGMALEAMVKNRVLRMGDTVVLTAGVPPGVAGNTNLILVRTV